MSDDDEEDDEAPVKHSRRLPSLDTVLLQSIAFSSPYFGYRFSKQDASPITELPALRRHRRSRLENGLLLFGSVLVVLVGEEGDVLPGMSSALHVLLPLLAMPSSSSSSSSASTWSTTSIDCFLVGLSASSSSPLSVFPPPPESWNETIDSRSEGLVHTV
ncbi:hypothetical protein TYRP_005105 [Tyrophagus putrescentiae]|nr:hypothetical protein TYRP_005105 [Tyrophagus putrescentiae]